MMYKIRKEINVKLVSKQQRKQREREREREDSGHYSQTRNLKKISSLGEAGPCLEPAFQDARRKKIVAKRIYVAKESLCSRLRDIAPLSCPRSCEEYRTKLGLSGRQGRLLQYARIRKRTKRRGNGADKVKSTAKSR